jgi:hypothetical protein
MFLEIPLNTEVIMLQNMEEYKVVQKYFRFESRGSVIVTTRVSTQAQLCRREMRVISKLTEPEVETLFVYLLGWTETEEALNRGLDPAQVINNLPGEKRDAVRYLLGRMDGLALGIQQMVAQIKFQELANDIARFADKYRRRPHRL